MNLPSWKLDNKIMCRYGFRCYVFFFHLTEVTENSVYLADGSVIPCGLVVWSTGLAPRPFTKKLEFEKNDRGQLLTDSWLQVRLLALINSYNKFLGLPNFIRLTY